jgi:hypothetical protein
MPIEKQQVMYEANRAGAIEQVADSSGALYFMTRKRRKWPRIASTIFGI